MSSIAFIPAIVRRSAWPVLALAVALLLSLPARLASQTANPDDVKAAFLFNFAKFVEWPADSAAAGQPLNLGVLGNDAVVEALRGIVKDKTISGRRLAVKRVTAGEDLSGLQLLFVGQAEKPRLGEVLKRVDGTSVLTVSDADRFCEIGGVIALVVQESHVRFDVSLESAERAHLKVSSKLLSLARVVHGAKQGER